jgi:hypothetical protein
MDVFTKDIRFQSVILSRAKFVPGKHPFKILASETIRSFNFGTRCYITYASITIDI